MRFGGLFNRRSRDRELADELASHLEMHIEENLNAGMSPEEARRQALIKLGGIEQTKENYRDRRRLPWLDTLLQDIRFGLRTLRKNPGFTAVAVVTLALGIGANTAIFTLIDAVLLRSLPAENPSQLALLKWGARNAPKIRWYASSGDCATDLRFGAANPSGCSFSEPMFREIAQANAFSGVAAFANAGRLDLTGNGPAKVIDGQLVSGDFFRTLGLTPTVGRVIEPRDDSPSAPAVAVLNYGYWQSAFGGARSVVGRTLQLNGVPFTIVGVAEQKFTGLTPGSDYQVWLPLADAQRINTSAMWRNRQDDVTSWWLTIVGRLKSGEPLAQAQASVSGIFRDEMLHGSVPLFAAGGPMMMPGPGGGPRPGNGPLRNQMVIGGPPGARVEPQAVPGKEPDGRVTFYRTVPPPAGSKGPVKIPAPAATTESAKGQASGEMPGGLTALSAPADDPTVTLLPAQTSLTGTRTRYADPLYLLMLAVGIILLIACANVAGLMLARSAVRQKEMAVRLALGAGRMRIVRLLLTESVMLSVLGGVLGIFFAYWGTHTILSFVSSNQSQPLGFAAGVDARVLGFTIGISLLTGILFGLAPALRSARLDLNPMLKEGEGSAVSGTRAAGRWFSAGNVLVVSQVALAIVVLVSAGLLVRTLANLRSVDIGFDAQNLINFNIDPTLAGYKDVQLDSFYRDLQGRLAETPGVQSVSYSMVPLLSNGLLITAFHWPGTPQDRPSEADMLPVGLDFFRTMQISFLAGRQFNASDYELAASNSGPKATSAPTPVIVNQAFVEKYLGKENPVGKEFGESAGYEYAPPSPGYEIVGVVRDAKYNSLRREIHPMMYTPQSGSGATFEVRTAADPRALLPAIREVVAEINANLPLFEVTTESEQIDRLLFEERLVARLSGFFGLLALVLACIGLYGLLSYEVARRTREIGVRMALGAQQGDVMRLILKQGIGLAFVGAIVGVGVALGVTRYLNAMLYGVSAYDPVTIIAVAGILALVALAACYIPARRAMRVDPMVALRYE
jgi:predicted permease